MARGQSEVTHVEGLSAGETGVVGFCAVVDSACVSVDDDTHLDLRAAVTCGGSCSTCLMASRSSFLLIGECLGGRGGGWAFGSTLKMAWGGGGSGPAVACRPGW